MRAPRIDFVAGKFDALLVASLHNVQYITGFDGSNAVILIEREGEVTLFTDPLEAVAGVDVVVTDTWVSMGKEDEKAERLRSFGQYQVNAELMDKADESVTPEVLQYVNRLSDYLFVAARYANDKGAMEILWRPGENR